MSIGDVIFTYGYDLGDADTYRWGILLGGIPKTAEVKFTVTPLAHNIVTRGIQ